MDAKNKDYLSMVDKMTPSDTLPGVEDFIRLARKQGFLIALGSASKNARGILQKIELIDAFDVIIDGNEVKRAKPDPEVFTRAADRLKVAYERCIVFEDSIAGIEAANAAGMISIGIGQKEHLAAADRVFDGFDKMVFDTIKRLEK
jgi:beta-phosphoglucomutase